MDGTQLQDLWVKIGPTVIQWAQALAFALLIFIIGKWVAKMVSKAVEKALQKSKINDTLASFTKNLAYFAILTFVVIAALSKLGIETNSFIAIVGAAGLAVGLALQGSLANFAAGVMIIILQPFKVGDHIEAGGAAGTVKEIQIFSTIMVSPDNKKIIVPNAKITSDKITIMKT
jgi:small conductance mechanosensitive channel